MKYYVVTAIAEDDIWSYGTFDTLADAEAFALKMEARFPDVNYAAHEIFAVSDADFDLVSNG